MKKGIDRRYVGGIRVIPAPWGELEAEFLERVDKEGRDIQAAAV